jgi:hypothetical protein
MSKNQFCGAAISYDTVKKYYPINSKYPEFYCFIFQPMIDDTTKENNDYTLIAYAVKQNGGVLDDGSPIPLIPLTKPRDGVEVKGKKVYFANLKLCLDDLKQLYPLGSISNLDIYPSEFFKNTGYLVYTAETYDSQNTLITKKVNPSPPA